MKKFLVNFYKGKLFGHPVHMMLVHFPSALFPVSLLADFAAIYFKENYFHLFSFYAAGAGVATGIFALIFGIIDLFKMAPNTKEFNIALIHGGLNFLWLTIFSIITGLEMKNYPSYEFSLQEAVIKSLAVTGLMFSNFLGGELVLKYGIGKKD